MQCSGLYPSNKPTGHRLRCGLEEGHDGDHQRYWIGVTYVWPVEVAQAY